MEDFEKIVVPYMDEIYRAALARTKHTEEAQDLTQDVFLKAFRFFGSFKTGTNVRAWLYRILHNAFIDRYRKSAKTMETSSFEDVEDFYLYFKWVQANMDPEEEVLKKMTLNEIKQALSQLPDEFEQTVILCDMQGLSYEEAAEALGCKVGTVRSRLHRGRNMLQKLLWEQRMKLEET